MRKVGKDTFFREFCSNYGFKFSSLGKRLGFQSESGFRYAEERLFTRAEVVQIESAIRSLGQELVNFSIPKELRQSTPTNKLHLYKDVAKQWRWQIVATENGDIIGSSSEGYKNKQDAVNNLKRLGFRQ